VKVDTTGYGVDILYVNGVIFAICEGLMNAGGTPSTRDAMGRAALQGVLA